MAGTVPCWAPMALASPRYCACCMESLVPQVSGKGFDVFPIGMYMRESYLDKQV